MQQIAIKAENLSKLYHIYDHPIDRLKEALHPLRRSYHQDFYALKEISFELKKGETLGIIGANGAGKSTLLKILAGVITPTTGKYQSNGKISSLLELGVGFNPELTGIENIFFYGSILGYSEAQMQTRLPAILEFAEIGEFAEHPLKTYSTGMQLRLAFAVIINLDHEILIIDEAIAVGDARFQQKCLRKINELSEEGTTIVIVTHDTNMVTNYCDRVIWLEKGQIKEIGNPKEICLNYLCHMTYDKEITSSNQPKTAFGTGLIEITNTKLYNQDQQISSNFNGGEQVRLEIEVSANNNINQLIAGFILKDVYGNAITGYNNALEAIKLNNLKQGEAASISFRFTLPHLRSGKYFLSPAIASGTLENHTQHHWIHDELIININDQQKIDIGWNCLITDAITEMTKL